MYRFLPIFGVLVSAALFCEQQLLRNSRNNSTATYSPTEVHFYWRDRRPQHHEDPITHVPIFIIFKDKITALYELLRSLHELNLNNITIIDTGSELPETLRILQSFVHLNIKRLRNLRKPRSNTDREGLDAVFAAVGLEIDKMMEANDSKYYVVTDPDLSLHDCPADILHVMQHFLDTFQNVSAVATALRLDDVPDDCIFCHRWAEGRSVFDWESQFWPDHALSMKHPKGKGRVYYAWAPVDTTFAMVRRDFRWRALYKKNSIRILHPYASRHVDWYYKKGQPLPFDVVFSGCTSKFTHAVLRHCVGLNASIPSLTLKT